jgi:hypothetical protein
MNCIERLSNEIFYEIFEYLDGCDMFNAFSNLNIRFQNLLNHSSLRLKINIDFKSASQFQDHCSQFIVSNEHRIVSLRLLDAYYINPFLQLCNLNSTFSRLESLTFVYIKPDEIISLLPNLTQLPRLFSLTVYLETGFTISNEFYQLIFHLPYLKYNKLSTKESLFHIPLSSFINKQISKIEHLIIDHPCDLNQLIAMLSCTPDLRHLTCKRTITLDKQIQNKNLRRLSNLTHIFFCECRLEFRDLEKFMEKISSQLRVLYINTSLDSLYLDADRWERIISQHLPLLRTFNFEYKDFNLISHNVLVNKFTSSFWIDRRWIFELKVDMHQESITKMIYGIHSYKYVKNNSSFLFNLSLFFRKKWFTLYYPAENNTHCNQVDGLNTTQRINISGKQKNTNSLVSLSEGTELIVQGHDVIKFNQSFIANIDSIFPVIQITCLHIGYFYPFYFDVLVDLIRLLPNLDSVIISYVTSRQIGYLCDQQLNAVRLVSNKNRITRVRIGGLTNLDQLHTFINLCPRMEHLEIGHTDDIDRKMLVRSIMMKNIDQIPHLCSLYLWMPEVNEKFIKTFQKSTDLDKLLDEYQIICMSDGICLQWNRHRLIALKKLSYMHLRNQKH